MRCARDIFAIGLSHRTASLDVREQIAVRQEHLIGELQALASEVSFGEVLLVSTCNRVEIYGVANDPVLGLDAARSYLKRRGCPYMDDSLLYEHTGIEAVRHSFRVASSLDSMVVGESQILGQMKEAFTAAERANTLGGLLSRCFSHAFQVAKRVRSETKIALGSVSVSSVACELAEKIFGELQGRRVTVVGAGTMAEEAARRLSGEHSTVVILNRSPERAQEIARSCGGEAIAYEDLEREISLADVAIVSTAAERFVLTVDMMRQVVRRRKRRPLFLIDLAVPRNIDPRIESIENVFLYNVDDLQQIAEGNLARRGREAKLAEGIVDEEVRVFNAWRQSLEVTPTIVALRERFRGIVTRELERTLRRLDGINDKDREMLRAMADSLVTKLLHRPMTLLKEEASETHGALLVDVTKRLFDLRETASAEPGEDASKNPGFCSSPEDRNKNLGFCADPTMEKPRGS